MHYVLLIVNIYFAVTFLIFKTEKVQYYLTIKILMRKLVATVYSEEVGQWIDSGLDQAVPQYNISLPQREFVLNDVK